MNLEKSKSMLRTNMLYGLLVLVPCGVVIFLLLKLLEILEQIAKSLGLHSMVSAGLISVAGPIAVVIICFLVGALIRTNLGSWSFEKLERTLLKQVPGYDLVGKALKGFAEKKEAYRTVLISLHGPGISVFGFVMEENDNGTVTIFVPSVPAITMGNVFIVERNKVTFLKATGVDVTNCLSQWGTGTKKILPPHQQ